MYEALWGSLSIAAPGGPAEPQQLSPLTAQKTHFIHIHTNLCVYLRPSRCTDIWEIVEATATKKEKLYDPAPGHFQGELHRGLW